MNSQERENFWTTLCALSGEDVQQERKKLTQTIRYPKYLFRYRPVSFHSLEALRTNRLYFSSANYYDDPFDTFLHINVDTIRKKLNILQTPRGMETAIAGIKSRFSSTLTTEQLKSLTAENMAKIFSKEAVENFLRFTLALRDEVKKDTWSVCFSENGFNEVLWLKYADQHKGFVQIYDLNNDDNFLCGKREKCANCGIKKFGTPLYPVFYSDSPYDATDFAKIVIAQKLRESAGVEIPQQLYEEIGNGFWEREKTTLVKKKCHEYDEEWRIITGSPIKPPIMMEWIPSGIILGLRMSSAEENLVVSMAKEAGIKSIYKSYIDVENKLDAVLIQPT